MPSSIEYNNKLSASVAKFLESRIMDLINKNDVAEAERITLEIIKKLQMELNHVYDMLTELYLNEQYIHISPSELDNSFSNLQTCLRILNKYMGET